MNTEELTQVVTAHQSAISRHDSEMAEIRVILQRVGERLDRMAERQEVHEQLIESTTRQGALNQEAIATLTASIQDLRNLVADYLQGRSN